MRPSTDITIKLVTLHHPPDRGIYRSAPQQIPPGRDFLRREFVGQVRQQFRKCDGTISSTQGQHESMQLRTFPRNLIINLIMKNTPRVGSAGPADWFSRERVWCGTVWASAVGTVLITGPYFMGYLWTPYFVGFGQSMNLFRRNILLKVIKNLFLKAANKAIEKPLQI
jgi:hypothetical protein